MKVPMSWLREYVDVDVSADEMADLMSVAVAEVTGIERRGPADTTLFKVGRVLTAEKHPNADRLQLTTVDVGGGQTQQIVCGAWNFGAGATVAVALPGATLPNGLTLERRELRGQMSEGMILAEDEVDLGTDHEGIMLLPDGVEPGTPLADVLPLVEEILDIELTGNRPDLFSVYGIAREVAALFDGQLVPLPDEPESHSAADEELDIRIEDFDGCPRYVGRLFRDVTIGAVAAVAAGAHSRRRHAPDLERRRRDELRDARSRQPAARVRLRHAGGRDGSSSVARRRARRSARSTGRNARSYRTTF